jgi:hypothetical protein
MEYSDGSTGEAAQETLEQAGRRFSWLVIMSQATGRHWIVSRAMLPGTYYRATAKLVHFCSCSGV